MTESDLFVMNPNKAASNPKSGEGHLTITPSALVKQEKRWLKLLGSSRFQRALPVQSLILLAFTAVLVVGCWSFVDKYPAIENESYPYNSIEKQLASRYFLSSSLP